MMKTNPGRETGAGKDRQKLEGDISSSYPHVSKAQADTHFVSVEAIMRNADFAKGVADQRARRPPRFDEFSHQWDYEYGRLWATIAPRSMLLKINGRLNPAAVKLFEAAEDMIP